MSYEPFALRIQAVSKSYALYEHPSDRLKQFLMPRLRSVLGREGKDHYRQFHALDGVSFDLRRGESVGIIGRNGAGKSTLLQIISGTLTPTSGAVSVTGRVSALLELGAGFNPDFTGLENIYTYGSILGLDRAAITAKLDEILAFADIGEFVNHPVKTYSSGMFVRLAFAVAISVEPDVLIVDEALSVGDVYFQRKCYRRITEFQEQGGTLLLVTHSTDSLLRICQRGIVLEAGRKIYDGNTKQAVSTYLKTMFGSHGGHAGTEPDEDAGSDDDGTHEVFPGEGAESGLLLARLRSEGDEENFSSRAGYNRDETRLGDGRAIVADFLHAGGTDAPPIVAVGESITFYLKYVARTALERVIFGTTVRTLDGTVVYACNTFYDDGRLYSLRAGQVVFGEMSLECPLLPGYYFVTVGISQFDETTQHISAVDRRMDCILLTIIGGSARSDGVANMQFRYEVVE
jgi:lipopolysaccharide transport system ATP-binding protein